MAILFALPLYLLSVLVVVHTKIFPFVTFLGQSIPNHGYMNLSNVGRDKNDSVQCSTDLSTCCSGVEGSDRGDWYFPDETRVPFPFGESWNTVYESRGAQEVLLHYSGNAGRSGIYRCDIETKKSSVTNEVGHETAYAGLYINGGNVNIATGMKFEFIVKPDLNGNLQFTLTCVSMDGPATHVNWTRDSVAVLGGMTVLDNPVTAQYTHTLTVTERLGGQYQCTVFNSKPSSSTAQLTLEVASAPTLLSAVQSGPTSILVSWNIPSPLENTTGYTIYYTGSINGKSSVSGGSTDNYTLTGLQNGERYNLSIEGTSIHLPSQLIYYVNIISLIAVPSKPSDIVIGSISPTSISISWRIPNDSVVEIYVLMWERDTSEECPDMDKNIITLSDVSTSYIIIGLEEWSSYNITVTASNAVGSASDSITVMTSEASPSDIMIFDKNISTITIRWRPGKCVQSNRHITGYTVRYGIQGNGSIQTVTVSGKDSTNTSISGLKSSTTYSIEVAAVNSAGIGMYSNPLNVTTSVAGASIRFLGVDLLNHSYVDLTAVGNAPDGSDSVQCHTDLRTCCRGDQGADRGDWFSPTSARMNFIEGRGDIYELRTAQQVHLRRRNSGKESGIYFCTIETNAVHSNNMSDTTTRETVYVGLYHSRGGISMSDDMNFTQDSTFNDTSHGHQFKITLTCISTGGPATTVTWSRDSEIVSGGVTVLDDPVTAQYTHTLTVTGRLGGQYKCTVANNKPSAASAQLYVGALISHSLTVIQNGLYSVLVSWMTGGGAATVTGYTIYYQQEGGERRSLRTEAGDTTANISGLISGATYSLSIVALSSLWPSNEIDESFTIDPLKITLSVSSPITLAGETISLNCSVTLPGIVSGTPVFQWVGHGNITSPVDLSTSGQVVTSTLTLSPVKTFQAGQYTCTANLDNSTINATATVEVLNRKIPRVNISLTTNHTGPLYADTGLNLTCAVSLTVNSIIETAVEVTITWTGPRKGVGYIISETKLDNNVSRSLYTSNLTISSLAVDQDDGQYTCNVAVTGNGSVGTYSKSATINITVLEVLKETTPAEHDGSMTFLVVGVIMAVVLIASLSAITLSVIWKYMSTLQRSGARGCVDINTETNVAYILNTRKSQQVDVQYEDVSHYQPPTSDVMEKKDPVYETIQ